jgi:hypothetical protein
MGEVLTFKENIVIDLPDGFYKMTEEDLKEKNFLIKPEYIFTNKENAYIILEIKEKEKGEFLDNLKKTYAVMERITPGFKGLGMAKKMINDIEVGAIQYKSNTVTDELYNIMMICQVKDTQLMVSGHCVWGEYAKWKPLFFKMSETIREDSKKRSSI